MDKDTIIKILVCVIAGLVLLGLWRFVSGLIVGMLSLTTSLLALLISLVFQLLVPLALVALVVWAVFLRK